MNAYTHSPGDSPVTRVRSSRRTTAMAKGLGWFSIGLGMAELLAPRAMARATGLKGQEDLVRAYGLREIATGIGILAARNPAPWLWARAGGDALDLATLGRGARDRTWRRERAGIAMAAVAGVAAVDLVCAQRLSQENSRKENLTRDYSQRSGFPKPPQEMRGAALADFKAPADMQTPALLRPVDEARTSGR